MLRVTRHDDVLRLETSSAVSRAFGYTASAYLVRDTLVDTGIPAAARELARFLDERAARGRPVRGAVVTHEHEDHAGNVEFLARRGIPLALGAATLDAVRAVAPIGFYRRVTWRSMPSLMTPHVPFDPHPLRLVATPGHSPDHHAVWDPETETLFGGDLFLGTNVRIAHVQEDPRRLVDSLRTVLALRPRRLFDAHRGPVDRPLDALAAKVAWTESAIDAIERLLARGWDDRRIRRAVFGPESLTGYFSAGNYSRTNFVRAVRKSRDQASGTRHQ